MYTLDQLKSINELEPIVKSGRYDLKIKALDEIEKILLNKD